MKPSYDTSVYGLVHLPHDKALCSQYLQKYKDFRLYSLKTSPEAFSSTYEREINFEEAVWSQRLENESANTFIIYDKGNGNFVASATLLGPLPFAPTALGPDDASKLHANDDGTSRTKHYRLNAVFTFPEHRGHGLAQGLMEHLQQFVIDEAKKSKDGSKGVAISCLVKRDQTPAMGLYRKCGFEMARFSEPGLADKSLEGKAILTWEIRNEGTLEVKS